MPTSKVGVSNLIKAYSKKLVVAWITITLVVLAWVNVFLQTDTSAKVSTVNGISYQVHAEVEPGIGATRRDELFK